MDDPRPTNHPDDAFCEQVVRYLDGKNTADEWALIERDLRENPRRRELFLDICLQAALIAESASDIFSQSQDTRVHPAETPDVLKGRSPVLGFLHNSLNRALHEGGHSPFVNAAMLIMMTLCAGIVATVFVAFVVLSRGVNVHVDGPLVAQNPPPASPLPLGEGQGEGKSNPSGSVARLIHTAKCGWADAADAPKIGDDLNVGRKLLLKSGIAEIYFQGGARALLQGPASLELRSKTSANLNQGKCTITVEDPLSRGFEIHTPGMKFTDLGTEFGVLVANDGAQEVHVFRGRVQAETAGPPLPPVASDRMGEARGESASNPKSPNNANGRLSAPAPLLLAANESIHIETPQGNAPLVIVRQPANPKQFAREMPDLYPELVLSMHPVAYYRLERPKDAKDRLSVVDSAGGHNGTLHLGEQATDAASYDPYARGRFSDAMRFRKTPIHDYVIVPDYPQAKENHLSVSAWALAESRPSCAQIVANWGESSSQFHLGCFDNVGDLWLRIADSTGAIIDLREGGESPFPLDAWQHVAFTIDGKIARLYRNGYEVKSMPCNGIRSDAKIHSMAIGCRTDDTGQQPAAESRRGIPDFSFWHGRIDEVALFHRALSAHEVQVLCQGKTE